MTALRLCASAGSLAAEAMATDTAGGMTPRRTPHCDDTQVTRSDLKQVCDGGLLVVVAVGNGSNHQHCCTALHCVKQLPGSSGSKTFCVPTQSQPLLRQPCGLGNCAAAVARACTTLEVRY
jgi:hypothetical protein